MSNVYRVLSAVLFIWALFASIGVGYFYMLAVDLEVDNQRLRQELASAEETVSKARNLIKVINSSLSNLNQSYQSLLANYTEALDRLRLDLNSGYVSLVVDFGNGTSKYFKFLVVYGENDTVFDLLLASGLDIDYTEYPEFNDVFINCIGGVCGEVTGESSGLFWLLYVNGEASQRGAKQTTVVEGDVIEWRYREVTW